MNRLILKKFIMENEEKKVKIVNSYENYYQMVPIGQKLFIFVKNGPK